MSKTYINFTWKDISLAKQEFGPGSLPLKSNQCKFMFALNNFNVQAEHLI